LLPAIRPTLFHTFALIEKHASQKSGGNYLLTIDRRAAMSPSPKAFLRDLAEVLAAHAKDAMLHTP
jgi:hypothetical protein